MNILALAYIFPPDSGSGTYRSLYFFNHLVKLGENVTVVTVKEEKFSPFASVDFELRLQIDTRINIIRTSVVRPMDHLLKIRSSLIGVKGIYDKEASTTNLNDKKSFLLTYLKDMVSSALTCPDEQVGWIPYAVRNASKIIRSLQIDCVYATGGPWSALIASALIKKKHKIPLILDFRDPWANNPDKNPRSKLIKMCHRILENFCIKNANYIIANTKELCEDFIQRYPSIDRDRFITITNGFEDINMSNNCTKNNKFTLVHAGEIYLSRKPDSLFKAIQCLIKERKIPKDKILIQFVGGYSPNEDIIKLLQTEELNNVVDIIARVPHSIAIQYQMAADALLIFQTEFPLQVPRKIYEYMSMLKPVLAITEQSSATARIIERSKIGIVADQSIESIKNSILSLFKLWEVGKNNTIDINSIKEFKNEYLARQLQSVLREAIKKNRKID